MKKLNARISNILLSIARRHLCIDSLTITNSGDDFKEVDVAGVKKALEAAYRAGFEAGRQHELQR